MPICNGCREDVPDVNTCSCMDDDPDYCDDCGEYVESCQCERETAMEKETHYLETMRRLTECDETAMETVLADIAAAKADGELRSLMYYRQSMLYNLAFEINYDFTDSLHNMMQEKYDHVTVEKRPDQEVRITCKETGRYIDVADCWALIIYINYSMNDSYKFIYDECMRISNMPDYEEKITGAYY